jgi:hypothetical protein
MLHNKLAKYTSIIAQVAATTHILNFCVTTMILDAYKPNIVKNIANVNQTDCITTPGKAASYIIEIAHNNKPSNIAYTGAKYGANFFLKIIIRAKIKVTIINQI